MNANDTAIHRHVPENIAAEAALLGAIFVNNAAFDRVSGFLEPDHFYEPIHRKIFKVCGELIQQGKAANPVLIKPFLPAEEKIGDMTVSQYLARLAASAVTVINAKDYALAVHDLWIRRQAIAALEDAAGLAYDLPVDADVLKAFEPVEDRMAAIRAEAIRSVSAKNSGQSYLDALQSSYQRGQVNGVPICLNEIADVISEPCFEAGNLYGLLSSSGEGKTSLTVQQMHYALRKGHPVLFLSYDQSSDQVIRQMISQVHDIEARRQRDAKLLSDSEFETCMRFAEWIGAQPFDVVKCTDQSAPQLVSHARTFAKRRSNGKTPLVVVDHIGVVKPEDRRADEGTKAKGIGQILKAGAEMTAAAWLVLNQRNSFGMKRDNPRPISMDLFGGDPAKTPFDAIFYLYRFIKFLEERKAIASSDSDWKRINTVFPSAVRDDGLDIAEIGSVKCRFGTPHIRKQLIFEARFTRYRSEAVPPAQAELLEA
jgi:replicative DNA helicase